MAFTKITASGIGSTETVTLDGLSVINDGSFGGNLSVGGTLTYEDVTNIDSVGLITARAGVVVGSGITLSVDGDGFFTGVVTATTFKGDGSQLSNVTSTTINNNADNRLITGSGTANTLEAEANLTFDATNFTTKASDSTTSANAGGSGIKIQNTNNTNNNQNFLGFFDSTGTSSAAIIGQHENHSSTTGNLQFGTRNAGTYAERMRIDSSGRLLLGTTTQGYSGGDDLTINTTGDTGMTIRSGTSNQGTIAFADGTSSSDQYRGFVQYFHNSNTLMFGTDAANRVKIDSSGHLLPNDNDTYDLGSSSLRWRDIYTGDLNLSNEGKTNDVDGTWGNYTIQEGENDLFLINNRSGKKYKFNLTEVT